MTETTISLNGGPEHSLDTVKKALDMVNNFPVNRRVAKDASYGGISGVALRQLVERIERLEEEKKGLAEDIKEVYQEARSNGFDVKIIRKILAIRKRDQSELDEEFTLTELYKKALGMQTSMEFDD